LLVGKNAALRGLGSAMATAQRPCDGWLPAAGSLGGGELWWSSLRGARPASRGLAAASVAFHESDSPRDQTADCSICLKAIAPVNDERPPSRVNLSPATSAPRPAPAAAPHRPTQGPALPARPRPATPARDTAAAPALRCCGALVQPAQWDEPSRLRIRGRSAAPRRLDSSAGRTDKSALAATLDQL
jgi:hypothetical protein